MRESVGQTLRRMVEALADAGLDAPEPEARLLLQAATGLGRAALISDPDRALDDAQAARLDGFLARRLAGEPATRIAGSRGFWNLDIRVAPGVLDPRPDSETIVAAALDALGPRRSEPIRILDLGTGSGVLLLALLAECPRATGLGVDLSPAACALAAENAATNGLAGRASFRHGRWTDGLEERFDLIVSNPPYIETDAIASLDAEVRDHDPHLALDGGADGLCAYRDILARAPSSLAPGGLLVFELGAGQAAGVSDLARSAGFDVRGLRRDYGGIDRALVLSFASGA